MKKKKSAAAFSAAKVLLGIIIGGVVASTAVAVFAVSAIRLDEVQLQEYTVDPTITSPKNGDVVGSQFMVRVSAGAMRYVTAVEVYADRSIQPLLLGRATTAYKGVYTISIPSGVLSDHSYESLYARVYPRQGSVVQTERIHVQIDGCVDGSTCLKLSSDAAADLHGLLPTAVYQLTWSTKSIQSPELQVHITDAASGESLAVCPFGVASADWIPSPQCTFQAQSESARITYDFPDSIPYETMVYIDAVQARIQGDALNVIKPSESSFAGARVQLVSTTPVTTRKPFAPSLISSVSSNFPISETQTVGVWFFKGWPRAHYSWWTRLGTYERPSLWSDPNGAYLFQEEQQDSAQWYSPLTLWFTRETQDPEQFSFVAPRLNVTTDIGKLDICLPDLDWTSPLINGLSITGLVVDQFGNTYYAGKYNDPDLLTYANAAKLCTCSDGTKIGQCTSQRTSVCTDAGVLEPTDCRTCGCAGVRETCKEQGNGTFACVSPILEPVEVDKR